MSSRIEQIIEEIEEYIDRDCKFQPLSTTKIIVNKELIPLETVSSSFALFHE